MGFNDPIEQARGYDPRIPIDADPQREDLGIPNETGTFQNYIERNDGELKRIHAIVHMATSSTPDIDMVIEETRRIRDCPSPTLTAQQRKATPCGKT